MLFNEYGTKKLVEGIYLEEEKLQDDQIDLPIIRNSYSCILWNCVFYFLEYGLPYDFMFPYVDQNYMIDLMEVN